MYGVLFRTRNEGRGGMKYKLLVTSRSFGTAEHDSTDMLEKAGIQIDRTDAAGFRDKITGYDALIIGAHDFPPHLMERCPRLRVVCKHGAELDNIPLDKARELGIGVWNVPGVNTQRVADLTFGLLLDVARRISHTNALVHMGKWQTATGTDVAGKTLGILGLGAIGKAVALRARGFGMEVIAFDPYVCQPGEELGHVTLCGMGYVLENSDFLSIHLPLTRETRNLLTEENLLKMKPGSYIINTAKAEVVDEAALCKLLKSGHLAGAAMDVCAVEPLPLDSPLLEFEHVIITPHIGVYSKEAIAQVSLACAKQVIAALNAAATEV